MSNLRRKLEVKKVRSEGAIAYLDGKARGSNPYAHANSMDTFQWFVGYDMAEREETDDI